MAKELDIIAEKGTYSHVFLLMDENSREHCLPLIANTKLAKQAKQLIIPSGEAYKSIDTIAGLWDELGTCAADRHSLLLNLGGGVLCDMGGFVASTFKRGMAFINIPTTLLAQVDASVGGKTGFNYAGLKNQIGTFTMPERVYIEPRFLATLGREHITAGYAEMLKHGLIYDPVHLEELLQVDILSAKTDEIAKYIFRSVEIKNHFVEADPTEKNLRKALNFGHTFAHAFESLAMHSGRELLHGHAVAAGMVCETRLSCTILGLDTTLAEKLNTYIIKHYPKVEMNKSDYTALVSSVLQDKKNQAGRVNMTLLSQAGKVEINQPVNQAEIRQALDHYRQL